MASRRVAAIPATQLFAGSRLEASRQGLATRRLATEAPLPRTTPSTPPTVPSPLSDVEPEGAYVPPTNPFLRTTQVTLHTFPNLAPVGFASYPGTHLLLPLRKDLLHRAVIYEGDATRQGTASTKYRSEVHGSGRKIRPQKGTGSARLGDKKSPMLRGGGVAFGPKPRDFSTELPRKVYDLAWRTALSYRYRMGELLVVDGPIEVQGVHESSVERYVGDLLRWNRFGRSGGDAGRTLFVTGERREALFGALEAENMGRQARALEVEWVDVKDLLEGAKVVVERTALEKMFEEHETDLQPGQKLGVWEQIVQPQAVA